MRHAYYFTGCVRAVGPGCVPTGALSNCNYTNSTNYICPLFRTDAWLTLASAMCVLMSAITGRRVNVRLLFVNTATKHCETTTTTIVVCADADLCGELSLSMCCTPFACGVGAQTIKCNTIALRKACCPCFWRSSALDFEFGIGW